MKVEHFNGVLGVIKKLLFAGVTKGNYYCTDINFWYLGENHMEQSCCDGNMQYSLECMENRSCVFDKYIEMGITA